MILLAFYARLFFVRLNLFLIRALFISTPSSIIIKVGIVIR